MARDYEREALQDEERNAAIRQWMQDRVEHLPSMVTAADVLARNGVSLRYHGDREEQISCPFHGTDRHPSARYYPEGQSRSHVWCFACHKQWDAIGLWEEFNGKIKFSQTLFEIEKAFGIRPPEAKIPTFDEEDFVDPIEDEVNYLFEACENRLREERDHFDMESHLKLGSLLDQIRFAVESGGLSFKDGKKRLEMVIEKIGEKVRASKARDTQR